MATFTATETNASATGPKKLKLSDSVSYIFFHLNTSTNFVTQHFPLSSC